MNDRIGQQLGNYQLLRLLGEGGFAEVYLGEHIHLGTQAAIKLLHTQLTSENVDQFRNEARTIARLIHPNIIRVLDFGVEGKTPFLVMDYASQGTLRQRHPRGERLPLTTILSYAKQMAAALQYAHDEKLIHRDIKPENMLVGQRGELLLGDFGIALVAQSSRYQSTQDITGTVAYMSPEQIQGRPRPSSDQYSLAIVVYEWLSGTRPFHGSFTEMCTQHMFATPAPLHEKISTISLEVEQVVMTALAKDPHQRFMSIQAFAHALEQAIIPTVLIKPTRSFLAPTVKATPRSHQSDSSASKKSEKQWLEEGNTHFNAGKYREAVIAYDEVLVLDPEDATTYNNRGLAYQSLEEYEKALADFNYAIKLNSRFVAAYYNRAHTNYDLMEYEKATADFNSVLALDPNLPPGYCGRGNAYNKMKNYQQAVSDYNSALSLDPEYTEAYARRGNTYFMLGDFRKAIKDFERAIGLDPEYAWAYKCRGRAYHALKKYQQSIADYESALELNPEDADIYGGRGLCYYSLKEYQLAIQDFDHALQLDPTITGFTSERDEAYRHLRNLA
jgi:serine/threonine protein kinase